MAEVSLYTGRYNDIENMIGLENACDLLCCQILEINEDG